MTKQILVDEDFYKDRCNKAVDRKIKLYETANLLELILDGAKNLDRWNGPNAGYGYVKEEIETMAESIRDSLNEPRS